MTLLYAAKSDCRTIAIALLNAEADINATHAEGETELISIADYSCADVVQRLINLVR